jgi:glycosyltransferase involved in cell wall biosynthesis
VGRISAQKDFATLLKALALARANKDVRLIVLGAVIDQRRVRRLQNLAERLGIANSVDFVGHVHNPYAFMARAAVFALSSRFEGCPNVLTEAHYCGCRIVTTACPGGVQELVQDHHLHALMVPVGDAVAMAAALASALDMPPRQAFRALKSFTSDTAATKYLDLFALPTPTLAAAEGHSDTAFAA